MNVMKKKCINRDLQVFLLTVTSSDIKNETFCETQILVTFAVDIEDNVLFM